MTSARGSRCAPATSRACILESAQKSEIGHGEMIEVFRRHGRVLEGMAAQVHVPGSVAGGRRPLGDDAEAHDLRADRRARRGARRPVCPSRWAASATGTTATPGSATPRSPSMPSSGSGTPRRRPRSASGCGTRWSRTSPPASPLHLMYRVDGSSDLNEETLDHFEGYRGRRRCGSATAPPISSSSTSTARPWTRSGSPTGRARAIGDRGWNDIVHMIDWLCEHWDQPDEGIWETRGGRRASCTAD